MSRINNLIQSLQSLSFEKDSKIIEERIADLLSVDKSALEEFERIYQEKILSVVPDSHFDRNAKQAVSLLDKDSVENEDISKLIDDIVKELVSKTIIYTVDNAESTVLKSTDIDKGIKVSDLSKIDVSVRPQLTGRYMQIQMNDPSYKILLQYYIKWLDEKEPKKKQGYYNHFRQGLDILDLDEVVYQILSMNKNTMSNWLLKIVKPITEKGFFKIPKTKIAVVPLTLLQLSRLDYESLNSSTMKIVDNWAMQVFDLDVTKSYFIKTGTYSSKYDFRNAKVVGEKEVRELGEYLLYIQNQASLMASPLMNPTIYGVSTTNEWVVREFIEDKENNPTIYKGLPLHTEYRVFVDFDTDEVLLIHPYWDADVLLKHFANRTSFDNDYEKANKKHDFVIFKSYEKVLKDRYEENKDLVVDKVKEFIADVDLEGQWSIDIMQNGDDFWLIDMALAYQSSFSDKLPKGVLKVPVENWMPSTISLE